MLAYIPWWNWKQSFHHTPTPSYLSLQSLFQAIIHRSVGRVKRRHIFRFDIWYVNVTLKQDWTFIGVKTAIYVSLPFRQKSIGNDKLTQHIASIPHSIFLGREKPWWGGSLGKTWERKKAQSNLLKCRDSLWPASACARWVSGVTCLLLAARPGFPSMMLLLAYCNWSYHFLMNRHKWFRGFKNKKNWESLLSWKSSESYTEFLYFTMKSRFFPFSIFQG